MNDSSDRPLIDELIATLKRRKTGRIGFLLEPDKAELIITFNDGYVRRGLEDLEVVKSGRISMEVFADSILSAARHPLEQLYDRKTGALREGDLTNPALRTSKAAANKAAEFIQRIDDLLSEETSRGESKYGWAEDTLNGIRESVERSGQVTENQERAVNNIEDSRR